jgi:predicted nucleic acid-binding protein
VNGFVLDCSIAVSWCFEDEASAATDDLLEHIHEKPILVPGLWHLEFGNVLLQAERRGRLNAGDVTARLELIAALPIVTDEETTVRALREILTLARAEKLTTYDAAYLELAMRRGLPLATRDQALVVAAKRVGVTTLP